MNSKYIQEAIYFDNRVTNMKRRFMRVITQDRRLGFLSTDGQVIEATTLKDSQDLG